MLIPILISINLASILIGFFVMANALENLRAQVERNTAVDQAVIELLVGLKTKLDDAIGAGDLGAVQSLSETLGRSTDALAAAIVANTPHETPPEQPDPSTPEEPTEENTTPDTPPDGEDAKSTN